MLQRLVDIYSALPGAVQQTMLDTLPSRTESQQSWRRWVAWGVLVGPQRTRELWATPVSLLLDR